MKIHQGKMTVSSDLPVMESQHSYFSPWYLFVVPGISDTGFVSHFRKGIKTDTVLVFEENRRNVSGYH